MGSLKEFWNEKKADIERRRALSKDIKEKARDQYNLGYKTAKLAGAYQEGLDAGRKKSGFGGGFNLAGAADSFAKAGEEMFSLKGVGGGVMNYEEMYRLPRTQGSTHHKKRRQH
jgi:hypothetical protein